MECRMFGSTDLRVSVIGFGAWAIGGPAMAGTVPIGWGEADDALSASALQRARACGITFYDTADFYGLGHSEELIGRAFGNAADVVIATKVGHRLNDDGSIMLDYSKRHIISACERSLRRLRRDAIDLYQLHSARLPHLEQGDCITAMEQLHQEGKIRYWGLSLNTYAPEPEASFLLQHRIGNGVQLVLNLLNQRALPLLDTLQQQGFGVIARMPLQFGLLTGKFSPATAFHANDHRSFRLPPAVLSDALDTIAPAVRLAADRRVPLATLALSWCASHPAVSTIIPGIRTPEQAESNAAPLVPVTDEDRERILEWGSALFEPLLQRMQQFG